MRLGYCGRPADFRRAAGRFNEAEAHAPRILSVPGKLACAC